MQHFSSNAASRERPAAGRSARIGSRSFVKLASAYCTAAAFVLLATLCAHHRQLVVGVNCDQVGALRALGANSHLGASQRAARSLLQTTKTLSSGPAQAFAPNGSGAVAAAPHLSRARPAPGGDHYANNKLTARSQLRRARRAANYAGRGKTGRIMLAQRPRSTTTTSTASTTTTSTSTAASTSVEASAAAAVSERSSSAEEPSESGDYEDLEPAKKRPAVTAAPRADGRGGGGGGEEEVEEGEAQEEGEQEEEQASTTTTTTTQRTTTTRRMGGARKGTAARNRPAGGKSGVKEAGSAQSSTASPKSRPRGEEAEEGDEAAAAAMKNPVESSSKRNESLQQQQHHNKRKPLMALPFIRPKNTSVCIPEAYLEFPRDLIGERWRARGLILVHVFVVCYMFYALALVCERYFMPSLEEFAQRLEISEDVAGATLMSAGSSAPELFTAILGVFVAKGDVGTGAIVGSAVFNILFVIGVCAFVSTTTAQLQWWPVLRDSVYYTFTVLVLIVIIYDERITAFESASMICLYGVYIGIMMHNEQLKEATARLLLAHPITARLISSQATIEGPDDVFGNQPLTATGGRHLNAAGRQQAANNIMRDKRVEDDSIYMAALLLVVRHKRLFRSATRFQSAARYAIVKRQHRRQVARELEEANRARKRREEARNEEVNYFGPESEPLKRGGRGGGCGDSNDSNDGSTSAAGGGGGGGGANRRAKMEAYARSSTMSKNKFSIVSKDDYEFWHRPPEAGENYYLWLLKIPVNYVLHYTCPDCTLYPDKYALTFVISICWTAFFSYIMVWMVTIIGYTLGIPDSVMGVTFLAAGTSVPDCYSSIHAARNGMADMAVSNSIGSNVFDILIGLAVPWFIQSAIYPGVVASVNSRGVIYSVVLLFLSLIVTIYLMNRCDWNLQPRLGLALIIAYALFIILTCMLEFNLFGHVNPPPCPSAAGSNY